MLRHLARPTRRTIGFLKTSGDEELISGVNSSLRMGAIRHNARHELLTLRGMLQACFGGQGPATGLFSVLSQCVDEWLIRLGS